ncbi:MAG: DNA cytosine methyltransferase [Candidatus Saccharimonadaceae bacterium]
MKSEKRNNKIPVPIIDLFAGPGGLAEGFSSVKENEESFFKVKLSIEKEDDAHKTLELRSFCRQFKSGDLPADYYKMLQESDLSEREIKKQLLFDKYKPEYKNAQNEAWKATLGAENFPSELIDKRITKALHGYKNWVLIGGPPCQAYSLVGRSRVGGIDKDDKRVYLYEEYLRIIATHQPAVFIMENVKGLLSAKLGKISIFNRILNDLKDPSRLFPETKSAKYKIYSLVKPEVTENKDFLIKSELYGVPQKRHRVILLGIREDLSVTPGYLYPSDEVSLQSVIGNLPAIRSGLNRECVSSQIIKGKKKRYYQNISDSPQIWEKYVNKYKKEILRWNGLRSFPDKDLIDSPKYNTGSEYIKIKNTINKDHPLESWYKDDRMQGITHHYSRSHLDSDLLRYLFASIFTISNQRFPRLTDYEKYGDRLMPDHDNAKTGKFDDRFRVQLPDIPATTVTSHISKDGHYFIHYDPKQCRTFTVREAARVQTFPDNYLFCGSRTSQYHQVGNAVPPYLAFQIAEIVKRIIIKI